MAGCHTMEPTRCAAGHDRSGDVVSGIRIGPRNPCDAIGLWRRCPPPSTSSRGKARWGRRPRIGSFVQGNWPRVLSTVLTIWN